MVRQFFRSVSNNLPSAEDFVPQGQQIRKGRRRTPPPYLTGEELDSWLNAISVFDTMRAATENALRWPPRSSESRISRLGDYIAILEIEETPEISVRNVPKGSHHYDLRGPAEAFLARVVRTVPLLTSKGKR